MGSLQIASRSRALADRSIPNRRFITLVADEDGCKTRKTSRPFELVCETPACLEDHGT